MNYKLRFFFIITSLLLLTLPGAAGQGSGSAISPLWLSSVHADTIPQFSVDPASIDFGTLFISSSFVETVTVSNPSSVELFITSVTIDSGDFAVSPGSATVPPFGSIDFYVSFTPTVEGTQNGNVIFVHNGPSSPDYLPLVGDGTLTDVTDTGPLPKKFALRGNYPNPFNPATRIVFELPKASTVSITVYNALGAEVARLLANEQYPPGTHEFSFDASHLATGVYFYRFRTPEFTAVSKMVLLK